MGRLWVIGHSGSHNHGNEAIIRGLHDLLGIPFKLVTTDVQSDREVGLDKICELFALNNTLKRYSLINILGAFVYKIIKNDNIRIRVKYREFYDLVQRGDVFLFEAGDQCFESKGVLSYYKTLFRSIKKRGGILVFLCGSIPENRIKQQYNFLRLFDEIIVRESISYKAVQDTNKFGNLHMAACPAFCMKPNLVCSKLFENDDKYIGVDVGYLLQGKSDYNKKLYEMIRTLIEHILNTTNYRILLIPHVNVAETLSDVLMEKRLEEQIKSDRVFRINEMPADSIKYFISKCHALITVRTHASIAAYSTNVPTLVIGYSQKSLGIAQDIFGNTEWVLDLHSSHARELIEKFDKLIQKQKDISDHLQKTMPDYMDSHKHLITLIEEKVNERNCK